MESVASKLWFSVWESLLTALLCLGIGGGLALLEQQLKIKSSKYFNALMAVPVFLPSLIVATGFIIIWGNAGVVNDVLGLKIKFLYSPMAIIAAHCFYNIPLAYLAISMRLASTHNYLEEAAQVCGANKWQQFRNITWARIKNMTMGIGIVIFLYSFLSFAIPLVLGGVRYQTLEVYIYNLVTQQLNFSQAIWLALLQFFILFILILVFIKYLKNIQEKKIRDIQVEKNNKNNIIIWLLRFIIILFIGSPIMGLLIKGFAAFDFYKLIELGFVAAWLRSFFLASTAIVVVLIISLLILFKRPKFGRYFLFWLAVSPIMVGILLLLIFGKSLFIMPLAYVFLLLPLAYYLLASAWEARPSFFNDVLKILGANPWQRIKTSLHYLLPALIKVMALGYALVLGDIAIASLLAPYREPTAMSLSYGLLGAYGFTLASAMMSIVLLSIFVIIVFIYLLTYKYDFERK